jgi:hypothetical protein
MKRFNNWLATASTVQFISFLLGISALGILVNLLIAAS